MAAPKKNRTFGGVKCNTLIKVIMLGILTSSMPSYVLARKKVTSPILKHIFNYPNTISENDVNGYTSNVYVKRTFSCWKRNATLWLVPTMYSIADGDRVFIHESYNRVKFKDIHVYDINRQVVSSTIRHNRRAMPTLVEFLTPNLYGETIYMDHLLSPFHRKNFQYYRYDIQPLITGVAHIKFKPLLNENTQLVSGEAVVDFRTGRIISSSIDGEFDMIKFHTETTQGDEDSRSLLPKQCKTEGEFSFLGNRIFATFEAVYDCPTTLPDSIKNVDSRALIDSLRPIPLSPQEESIYQLYDEAHKQKPTPADSIREERDSIRQKKRLDFFNDIIRHRIADNLVQSLRYKSEHTYFKLSPILNPQYLSYSHSKGLSYKIRLGAEYYFNAHRFFQFNPWFGYNFKYKKFYFTVPLRFNYNPKRDGYIEVVYGNGNRTRHSSVADEIRHEHQDTLKLSREMELFDDNHLRLTNNIMLFDWIDIETGFSFHQRRAYEPEAMRIYDKPTEYRSFAPVLSFKLRPWQKGPVFTIDYERGIKGVNHSTIGYERWEFDTSIKHQFHPLRKLNIRMGSGFYTHKDSNHFVDYTNFRDNNLPEGWDDDWTGNFQLLSSRWYNESEYYVRTNLSYETPLLCASWLPFFGHYIEKERIYLSALSIEHTRPYFELGYGLTNRFFSIGLFSSFLNGQFDDFECKFTFELFRRW